MGLGKDLQAKVPLEQALSSARDFDFDAAILDQIREDGVGKDLVIEAGLSKNGEVRIVNFVTYLFTQRLGFSVIRHLAGLFDQVEMLE